MQDQQLNHCVMACNRQGLTETFFGATQNQQLNHWPWLAAGFLFLLLPAVRHFLESSMTALTFVQSPLFILLGFLIGRLSAPLVKQQLNLWNSAGMPGIVLASFTLGFWMIPLWIDSAIEDPWIGVLRYFSLVVLVGVPLAWSWPLLGTVGKAFVRIESLAMLLRIGSLYLIFPARLCNNFLLEDQQTLGCGFILLAALLALFWALPLFMNSHSFADNRAKDLA